MKKSFFTSNVLPHIVAVLVFLAITIIIFHPIIFEGKMLSQHDINQGVGSASEIINYREATGEEALWTNSMFGGMPAYLINIRWSGEKILQISQDIFSLFINSPMRETFLAFVSFYILLLVFGVRPYLAIGGALAYGLNTFFMVSVGAGHMWKVRAIAYMPLVIAGVHLTFRRKLLLGGVLTAFSMALEFYANHLQVTYYLFLTILIYGIVQIFFFAKEKRLTDFLKITSILILAVVIAIGTNFGRLWASYEYGKYSTRGKSELTAAPGEGSVGLDREYAFGWSSGKWETLTLLIPDIYGGASGLYNGKDSKLAQVLNQNNVPPQQINQYERGLLGYWGSQPGTAGPTYAGAILCFLFVLGIFYVDKKYRIWLITATIFSIMLSWGKNFGFFNNFMFDYFPGYSKFRSVTMTVVIALLTMNLLGFLGLENLLKQGFDKENKKKFFTALGIIGGLLLLVALFASPPPIEGEGIPRAVRDAVESDRLSIIRADVMRSIFFIALAFIIIYLYLEGKIAKGLFVSLFILFIVLDLALVDGRYLSSKNFIKPSKNVFFEPNEADTKILKDESKFRVLNLADPFNEARTSAFHFSIGGYHGAKMHRYMDLIERQLQPEIQSIMSEKTITKANTGVLSALNTKYFLAGQTANAVIKNPYALGNAWFVDGVLEVNSPDEEIDALDDVQLDSVAVIDKSKFDIAENSMSGSGTIKLSDYKPNKLTYQSSNTASGLAVFSEIYYPKGWKATIDGKEANILRVDYVLRGLQIPKGDHQIIFTFEPAAYYVGNTISLIFNLVLAVIIILCAYIFIKKARKQVITL